MDRAYSEQELERFKGGLLDRKRQIWQEVATRLRDDVAEEYQSQFGRALDDPERALVDLLGDTDMILLERRRDELVAIEEALQRIEEGTYGLCTDCGEPIPPRRLEAMPFAIRCVEDQTLREGRLARLSM